MYLVQIRTGTNEEGSKGGYYNYEYGFVDDLVNRDRRFIRVFLEGPHRYGIDDEEYYDNDSSDNRPDDVSSYGEDRYWMYVLKSEVVVLTEIEGDFEE